MLALGHAGLVHVSSPKVLPRNTQLTSPACTVILSDLVISEPGGSAAVPLHIDAVGVLLLGEV